MREYWLDEMELSYNPDEVIDEICSLAKDADKLCIIPSLGLWSLENDKFYEKIMYEKFLCENYDKLVEYKDKIYLHTINSGEIHKQFVGRMFRPFWIYEDVSLKRIKEVNDKIEVFTADIKKSSLSPFEKVMAIYMVATQFIESYKGNSADIHDVYSSVMHILSDGDDGYKIQCAGYTDLFCRMAYECGIHTKELEISFMKNHDKNDSSAHSVAVVDLDDEKYGIHGSFICDVRADSDITFGSANRTNTPSLKMFCLPFSDYNTLASWSYGDVMAYNINTEEITGKEKQYLSDERIDFDTIICPALQTVDDFIYEATSFDALVARERVILYNILHVRSLIDKNKPDVKDKKDVSEVSADSCHK